MTGDVAPTTDNVEDVASTINKEVLEAQKLVQLAAAQRMNTDLRRAIFCIIMSGEDYVDAFEKLLRLDLSGKQVSSLHNSVMLSLWFHLQFAYISIFLTDCRIEK